MRVAMYYRNSDIRLEEMPKPMIGAGEILLKVQASGICGSDVMEWYRLHKAPLVLGHEIAGDIVEIGDDVKGYEIGDRLVAAHHVPCNTCRYCLSGHQTVCDTLRTTNFDPGGFAQFVRLPPINVDRGVFRIPEEVSYEEATFTEPLACVLRGQRMASLSDGDTVLVLGSGISGLLHINLACALGAGRVIATDINHNRLEAARRFGADHVIDGTRDVPSEVNKRNDGKPADLVIVSTGALPAIEQAIASVDRGGTVLFFAPTDQGVTVPLSINDVFWKNDVTFTTTYAGSPADHLRALELIRSERVNVLGMITHRLPLSKTQEGFRLVSEASESIKVMIEPQDGS